MRNVEIDSDQLVSLTPALNAGKALAFKPEDRPCPSSRGDLQHCLPINARHLQLAPENRLRITNPGLIDYIVALTFELGMGLEMNPHIQVPGASSLRHVPLP